MQYSDRTECFIAIRTLIGGVKGFITPLPYLFAECAAPYLALCWYVLISISVNGVCSLVIYA